MKKAICLALLTLWLSGCGADDADHNSVKIEVAPQQVACTGITQQRCFEVRFAEGEAWQLYYGNIKGFTYKPGFQYWLEVKQQHAEQSDKNASQLAWELVKEVSRTQVAQAPVSGALPTVTPAH